MNWIFDLKALNDSEIVGLVFYALPIYPYHNDSYQQSHLRLGFYKISQFLLRIGSLLLRISLVSTNNIGNITPLIKAIR